MNACIERSDLYTKRSGDMVYPSWLRKDLHFQKENEPRHFLAGPAVGIRLTGTGK